MKTIKGRFEGKIIDRRTVAWDTMDQVVADAQTEIGNLWMWLADITYQDWKQYHGLQDMTNSIKQRIHSAAIGPHFDNIATIQDEAEAQINIVAKEAAGKLAELKEVGREKILLGDASENFGAGWIPVGVKMAGTDFVSKVSEVVHASETPTGVIEQVEEAMLKATDVIAGVADDVVTKISEVIYGTPQGVVESIVSEASKAVVGEEPPLQSQIISSGQEILSSATEAAADAASKISEAVIGTQQGVAEEFVSQLQKISEVVPGTSQGVVESVVSQATSVAGEAFESASSIASSIIEDLPSASDVTDSVTSAANDAMSAASSVASNAASLAGEGVVFAQQGAQKVLKIPEPEVVHKATDAAASVADDVASKVSEVVYGTEPGIVEKATDAAASVGDEIFSKASEAIYGTEPGIAEKATEAAASVAEEIANKASEVVYGTEPGVVEKASSIASSIASEASEAVVGKEPGTMEKVGSAAESVLDEAMSQVSGVVDSASSVVSSVASEATEAYGAATSKVWENK